jgi:hypothetical protein
MDDRSKLRLSAIDRRAGRGSGRAAIDKDLRALKLRFIGARVPIFASGCAAPSVAFFLGQKLHPTLCHFKK